MRVAVLLVAAVLFGGGVQYLGSMSWHPWGADISGLSAPWVAMAFVAGATQVRPGRAVALGLVAPLAALVGYGAMTLSPIENAVFDSAAVAAFVRSELEVLGGNLVTGSLFGWFGYRWAVARWPLGILLTAALFAFEPLARLVEGRLSRYPAVWITEIAVGAAIAAYALWIRRHERREARSPTIVGSRRRSRP